MKNHFIFFFILALCVTGCNQSKVSQLKQLDITLNTVLELPDSTIQDSTVYFSHPSYVVTDSENNIIVADAGRNELVVFNKDGKFLYTIGERGPGPGEFRNIKGMTINKSDEIFVFDSSSQTIKKFTSGGKYISSYRLQNIAVNIEFEHYNNNQFVFNLTERPNSDKNNLLHIYSSDYDLIGEGIPYQSMESLDQDLLITYISVEGNSHFINGDTLYFAPTIYNGFIYQYEIEQHLNQHMALNLLEKISGHTFMEKPAESFNNENLSYADATITLAGGEKNQILVHNLSRGLFQLSSGQIVHFTHIEQKEPHKRIFGVEVYDKAMNPIGYAPIRDISFDPERSNMIPWNVMWKDENDRFYIIDKENRGTPSIRVVTLEGIDSI